MSKDYQDLQYFKEEATSGYNSGLKMCKCPTSSSSRLLIGLCILCAGLILLIITLIVTMRNPEVQEKDKTLEQQLSNLSVSVNSLVDHQSLGETRLMEKLSEIDSSVKKLPADTSIGLLQNDMQRVVAIVASLKDYIRKLENNGSLVPECPQNWSQFSLSCYYISKRMRSWNEAKTECEGLNSHLVVINSEDEQVASHSNDEVE
ncbi:asialoglycoprotein receptor 1-like [Rhinophrynus dorsalis]